MTVAVCAGAVARQTGGVLESLGCTQRRTRLSHPSSGAAAVLGYQLDQISHCDIPSKITKPKGHGDGGKHCHDHK